MKSYSIKLTWRSVRTFFGRYMAILLIVALSAGFFAGLKITTDAMVNACDVYLTEQNFYDFRLLSTLGFTEDDVERFSKLPGVEKVEGTNTIDALVYKDETNRPIKLMAMPKQISIPSIVEGRMPQNEAECLVDDELFDAKDIGTTISISDENEESVISGIKNKEFTIVGLVDSPLYLGMDRGTTGIGSGALYSYIYLPGENFTGEVYTEINITMAEKAKAYSDEYDDIIEKYKDKVTELSNELANERYEKLLADNGLTPEMGEQFGISKPEIYVLTRSENAGYVGFENDTAIIGGVANIFPIFFIMIAMLVCITTMSRMVDEERTQIGVLKALGYSDGKVMIKYLLYAGSATLIGWVVGFFLCTWGLPQIFWLVYNVIYDFTSMPYLFSPVLAVVTLAVSLVGILESTYISCRKELLSVPAKLIRPRTAKNGKRILLEYISPLWKRLSFLQKITLRNMFRYKKRLMMMLVGISCCAGLVVTAFGVRDSMIDIAILQYEEIQKYDIEAVFASGTKDIVKEKFKEIEEIEAYQDACIQRVDLAGKKNMNSVTLMSFQDTSSLSDFWDFHNDDKTIEYPKEGEAIINAKIADKLEIQVGDTLEIRDNNMQTCTITISGIFDNYLYNYIVISSDTYEEAFGQMEANTALICVNGDSEAVAEKLTAIEEITSVSRLEVTKENISEALACLDYIIWLVVGFSGALAFVVIFNLTNINLAERSREIATVQVLGFYPKETESYVLRENLILSVIAGFIGLPLGIVFHRVVMSMVLIDALTFNIYIKPISYVLALICTVLFAVIVDLFMKRQIDKIHMAESLKAVE